MEFFITSHSITPLCMAVITRNKEIVELLLKREDIEVNKKTTI